MAWARGLGRAWARTPGMRLAQACRRWSAPWGTPCSAESFAQTPVRTCLQGTDGIWTTPCVARSGPSRTQCSPSQPLSSTAPHRTRRCTQHSRPLAQNALRGRARRRPGLWTRVGKSTHPHRCHRTQLPSRPGPRRSAHRDTACTERRHLCHYRNPADTACRCARWMCRRMNRAYTPRSLRQFRPRTRLGSTALAWAPASA